MSQRVKVSTQNTSHDYDVIIDPGCLDNVAKYILQLAPTHSYAVITDNHVRALYADRVVQSLSQSGAKVTVLDFPAGEANKTAQTWQTLSEQLLEQGFGRDACLIALGGGVSGDLGGFVAATYMRGLPIVQIPTTLLAMIDASIGGKTGVDTARGKNLLGAFHQPRVVLIDPHALRTLSDQELSYGLAEAIKHGAIADAEYLAWITQSHDAIFEHRTHTVVSLIARSVEIKARIVSEDVHESGARAALNFGHTIAHAIEHASHYKVAHGQAVAVGMLAEAYAGEKAGLTQSGTADQIADAVSMTGLPMSLPSDTQPQAILDAARSDKKSRANELRYTLLRRIGEVARDEKGNWTTPLPDDVVKAALKRLSGQR